MKPRRLTANLTQKKKEVLFFRTVDVRKHHSCLDLLLVMRLSKVGEERGPLGFAAGKHSLRSAGRFGSQVPRHGRCTEAPLCRATTPYPACFSGLVWFGFAKHCCFRFLYNSGACVQKGQPQVKPGSFIFFQTWYADKPYPVEIKQI